MCCFGVSGFVRSTALQMLLLLLKVALSASEVVRLLCDVTALPGGLFQYRLSQEPGPDCFDQGWENQNNITLTREQFINETLVHNLTDQTLISKTCLSYSRYSAQCPKFVEAFCTFDCSSVGGASEPVEPSNYVCLGACFDQTHFLVGSVSVLLFVGLVVIAPVGFYKYKKRRGQRDLRQRADELDQPQKYQDLPLLQTAPLCDHKEPDVSLSAVRVD